MATSKLITLAVTIAIAFFIVGYSAYPFFHPNVDTANIHTSGVGKSKYLSSTSTISDGQELNVIISRLDSIR